MKHICVLLLLLVCIIQGFSQFTDNFEGYTTNDYLGVVSPDWTTWSGAVGGAEDVQIVSDSAFSGSNSIYFSSTANTGGPQDVVLPFGGEFNTGQFAFEMMLFVESNKSAYFNFQADAVVASRWSIDCYMNDDGTLDLSNTNGIMHTATYTQNKWIRLGFEIDLNTNNWELFLDSVSQGSFANSINQVASLNLYPVNPDSKGTNNNSGFWVDDVYYNHVPYSLPNLNGAVTLIDDITGLSGYKRAVVAEVRNLGQKTITSFDLTVNYNGIQNTESFTSVGLASLATVSKTLSDTITLVPGNKILTVTISNVNAQANDDEPNDDSKTINIDPIIPATGKMVIAEEATGTWCSWCVRGHVFMEHLEETYGDYYQGIAVHNGDPMVVAEYDSWMGPLIGGYPSGMVDRGSETDPKDFEEEFLKQIIMPPSALLENTATYDKTSRELSVSIKVDFKKSITGNWALACVLIEDNVTGTESGYDQANAYAGGSNGVMGGYENLPNPVPASQMVYNDVARAVSPSPTGNMGFTLPVDSGDQYTLTFDFVLDTTWNAANITIVGILIDNNGAINNGSSSVIPGFVNTHDKEKMAYKPVKVYPNPASKMAFIEYFGKGRSDITISVKNMTGQEIMNRNYGNINGSYIFPVNTSTLSSGFYIIDIREGASVFNTKLLVE